VNNLPEKKNKIEFRRLVTSEREKIFLMIFCGISGVWLLVTILYLFTEDTFVLGIVSVSLWLVHLLCFCIFLILNQVLKKNRKESLKTIAVLIISCAILGLFLQFFIKAHWQVFEPTQGLDSNIGNPRTQGFLFVEIDYSADLKFEIPSYLITYFGYEAFKKIGTQAYFIFDDPINTTSVKLSSDNMTEYALLCNSTKDFSKAVHLLILHNASIEGLTYLMGYAPRNPYWADAMKNFSSPGYCAAMVFVDKIYDPLQLIKCCLHEVGHYLGADHSQFPSIMQQGEVGSIIELFFSVDSQLQMNLYDKWSVEKGFEIYRD